MAKTTGDSIETRVLTPGDAGKYRELRLFALQEAAYAFAASHEDEAELSEERWIERATPSDDRFTLGAFAGDRLAGTVTFVRESLPKLRHRGNLVAMYVHPDYRGRGIGSLLVRDLLERARRLEGLRVIYLRVTTKNHEAKLLYAAHGFRSCGRLPCALQDGATLYDAEDMAYVLPDGAPGENAELPGDRQYTVWRRAGYVASDDPDLLDIDVIHRYLSEESYWAKGRTRESVVRSIQNSLICLGIYAPGGEQVGFARVVSDTLVVAWVCDVFVLEGHRKQGLGKWLVELATTHPRLAGVKRHVLLTRDAHGLYEQFGFVTIDNAARLWMERKL